MIDNGSDWFEKTKNKEKEGLTRFYNKYKDMLYAFIIMRVDSKEVAEDIHNESFEKALMNIDKMYSEKAAKNYLFVIAKNKIIDYYRTAKNKSDIDCDLEEIQFIDDKNQIIDIIVDKEETAMIREAIADLKPIYQKVIEMYYYLKMKSHEIGEKLGKSKRSIEGLLLRAKEKIRKYLEKNYKDRF